MNARQALKDPRTATWGVFLAMALLVADMALPLRDWRLLLVSAALLLAGARRAPRILVAVAGLALLVEGTARVHLYLERDAWRSRMEDRMAARLQAIEARKTALVGMIEAAGARVAALPDVALALRGDRAALTRLFYALESLTQELPEGPALSLHSGAFEALAWSGRIVDPGALQPFTGPRKEVFALEGSVTTTLVGLFPLPAKEGTPAGFVSATLPVAVRRNIRNEYLRDFDLFTGSDPRIEIQYADVRSDAADTEPFPPLDPALLGREAVLRAPDGRVLATVRLTLAGLPEKQEEMATAYRRVVSLVVAVWIVLWGARAPIRSSGMRLVLASTALRASLLYLGPPFPAPDSSLLSPDTYASTLLPGLLESPLDLLYTCSWLLVLAGFLLVRTLRSAPDRPSLARAALAAVLAPPVLFGTFTLLDDAVANSSLDLASISLLPRDASVLVIHVALGLALMTGACCLTCLMMLAGPLPPGVPGRLAHAGLWLALGLVAYRYWPRDLTLPPAPPVLLFLLATFLAGAARRWGPRLRAAPLAPKAGILILISIASAALLYPGLVYFGERNMRLQIEGELTSLVRQQPQWRAYVLAETERRIDALKVLEEPYPGAHPLGVEELAFSVWAATDLAARGVSSAVEIQDSSGAVISRFALDLPLLAARPLPANDQWKVSTEGLTLASSERRVLHARKLIVYHGEVHGAVHVYVADDFWNLPFLRRRDPYSVLYRSGSRKDLPDRPVVLLAYDPATKAPLFSSANRAPVFRSEFLPRPGASGSWTTLEIDGTRHRTFFFSAPDALYGLAYPSLTVGRFLADLVEAMAGVALISLALALVVVAVRTLLGLRELSFHWLISTISSRFTLRLLVAFLAVAALPVAVLELVVRGFVAERLRRAFEEQAVERASFAKKLVEDYVYYQRGEEGVTPIGDEQLVWVASVIRNDLEVFVKDRLLAASKRELYDSGLLAPRVSGALYRDLALEGKPFALQGERIGEFSYLVVSVPVRLGGASDLGILSIPLTLRQREVEAVVADLDRTMRLGSVLFVGLAAVLAHSMARRISGPISALTEATRRVAKGDLTTRVTTTSRDELMRLVESFNQMAGDLDRQRRDLERTNRLAAWGEMARQVAHEVKNPLTPIQLSAEHLRRAYRDGDPDFDRTVDTCIDTILKQVRMLRGIVTEFSAFARPPATVLQPYDPAALVADVLKPYQAVLPEGVGLSLQAGEQLPRIKADRRLLERAIVNLIENALQAVGENGRISVEVRAANEGGRVELEVRDSGPGLDPEIRDRVFEPFFSTKTSGSGLGLALVKKIAEDHGGGVTLESSPGKETRALLWLPASEPEGKEEPQAQ